MKSIKVFEYSRSRSFDDDLIQGNASGERSQDQWSSGLFHDDIHWKTATSYDKYSFCNSS